MKNFLSLNENEKAVLSHLLDNARMTDSEIAGHVGITPQGVRKIRLKLEAEVIEEYRTIVGYEKIGIEVFAIAEMKVLDKSILNERHIIGAFAVNESKVTHIFILGFSTIAELDEYKMRISNAAEIQKIYVVSKHGLLQNSAVGLIKFLLIASESKT